VFLGGPAHRRSRHSEAGASLSIYSHPRNYSPQIYDYQEAAVQSFGHKELIRDSRVGWGWGLAARRHLELFK